MQRVVLHVGEAPIELHPLAGELSQIDIAPAIAPGDVVIGLATHLFFHRMVVHRHAVIPHVFEPIDHVAPTVAASGARSSPYAEVNAAPGQVQVLGDLAT